MRSRVQTVAAGAVDSVLSVFEDELPTSGEEFKLLEDRLVKVAEDEVVGAVLGEVLKALHEHEEFVVWSMGAAQRRTPLESKGEADVSVRVSGGSFVGLKTPYMRPPTPKGPGRPRKQGKRGKRGAGLYPVLAVLGFTLKVSPRVASAVAKASSLADSYEEAREVLRGQGLELSVNRVRGVSARVADAVLFEREGEDGGDPSALANKRVLVCIDGGRVRYRLEKPGRRRGSGRHGFYAPWREPKVVSIYTVDEKGKKTSERPIYEGTLAPWEDATPLIASTLVKFGAKDAASLTIAADGSENIWRGVESIVAAVKIDPAKVTYFVDFYHGVGKLSEASKLVLDWTDQQRLQWVRKQSKRLKRGRVTQVILAMEQLPVADKAALEEKVQYLRKRIELMRYDELRKRGLPIGTGSVESAIRRVVNLRLKGAGIFWKPENAERILALRCRLKAGRWEEVEGAVYRAALRPERGQQPALLKRVAA